ncbi:replication endonuclease [Aliarcobacter butzleri]|uniref:replication endonuclease n=1 Tax=Aliarcobacter butzleri TaxID=28197 RepID=UPI0021B26880|nr:replication endonuclease [Aliarcobacter butzleri]MCT7581566.1 replication endonuclease [Aliarcobacter butzleri]
MKKIYATKTLQKDKLYNEIQESIKNYYQISIEKEQKQKGYLKSLKVFNKTKNEFLDLDYDFERKYKEYSRITQQRISTIEQMARDKEYVSLFITLTLPSNYHPFKSISYKGERLYTKRNDEFAFDSVNEAIKSGYQFLNEIYKTFYKRVKNFTRQELFYVKTIEAHTTLIPHLHCLLFFPIEHYDAIKGVYNRVIDYYKLQRADMEEVSIKDNINCASRYILKYIVKSLNDGSDYFEVRVLDGWKRAHKIRLLSNSQIPLNLEIYKKIYYSISNIQKNRIFSKKNYKLFNVKEIIDEKVRTQGIPIYYFFQENLFLEQKIFNADSNCSKTIRTKFGNIESLFHIKLEMERSRDSKNRLIYKIKKFIMKYRGIEIYQQQKYLILKNYI